MSEISSTENPVEVGGEYRGQVLTVEPHGIEQVSASERHGRPRALFTLWLSANMGLPVWLVGALAIVEAGASERSIPVASASQRPNLLVVAPVSTRHSWGASSRSST